MAETQIEWTDATWNPVAGCSIISAGCTHCYAMEMAKRLEAMHIQKYAGLTRKSGQRTVWNGVVREDRDALAIPYGWRKPRKIFVNSMSDLFHEQVSDAFILEVWQVMRDTPHHHYQILTKRPERMARVVSELIDDVLPNVWLGTSVEDSEVVHRIEHLRAVPAAIRFISFEPLIGPVGDVDLTDIHWAIVGGESGHHARPMHPDWARSLRDQCAAAGVPFLFKQWGEWIPALDRERADPDWRADYTNTYADRGKTQWLNLAGGRGFHGERFHVMQRVGKKAAGRLLDGVQHDGVPA